MDTIIQFIGLCVFTTLNPSATVSLVNRTVRLQRPSVVVILPNVPGPMTPTNPRVQTGSKPTPVPARAMPVAMVSPSGRAAGPSPISAPATATHVMDTVETHAAMIAFRQSDLICVQDWGLINLNVPGNAISIAPCNATNSRIRRPLTPAPLKQPPAATADTTDPWLYIRLSGEHLSFIADRGNDPIGSSAPLTLPHLGYFHAGEQMGAPYTPNTGYSGAAAVFTIANGTLSACTTPRGRVDTTLTLHTQETNQLTITTDGTRKVVLASGALVIVGNVPLLYAMGQPDNATTAPHYMVYCAMVGETVCPWPPPDPPASSATASTKPTDCITDPVYRRLPFPRPQPASRQQATQLVTPTTLPTGAGPQEMDSFTCSNSQWP
jgi:hypothetical protein